LLARTELPVPAALRRLPPVTALPEHVLRFKRRVHRPQPERRRPCRFEQHLERRCSRLTERPSQPLEQRPAIDLRPMPLEEEPVAIREVLELRTLDPRLTPR